MNKIHLKSLLPIVTMFAVTACNKSSTSEEQVTTQTEQNTAAPMINGLKDAMLTFRNCLAPELLEQCANEVDSERIHLWHNTPASGRGKRDGITYGDLDAQQLEKFKAVLKLFLSTEGYQKVHEITVLSEGWLEKIDGKFWNPDFYSVDLFGDPSKEDSWGFQLDGHHCAVTFVVQGDHVSIVPAFLGAEPAKGTFEGQEFDIFKDERELALELYRGMNQNELNAAVTKSSSRDLLVGPARRPGQPDPFINNYDYSVFKKGLKFSSMTAESQQKLTAVMKEYVYNLDAKFADTWWKDIQNNINDTYFVWIDDVDEATSTSLFYYRIYNPYLWVEFNTQNLTGRNRANLEAWNHVHTITRIPNNPETSHGGDYGEFAQTVNGHGPKTLLEHFNTELHHHDGLSFFDYRLAGHSKHNH